MSGYMPKPDAWKAGLTDAGRATPVLQCHGDQDPMVRLEWAEAAYQAMRDEVCSSGIDSNIHHTVPYSSVQKLQPMRICQRTDHAAPHAIVQHHLVSRVSDEACRE